MNRQNSNIIIAEGDNLTIIPSQGLFRKRLPMPYNASGCRIGLLSCSLYYSWENVTAEFNNLQCSYRLNAVDYPVNFPPGFYTIDQLNEYLHYVMEANGHYLLNELNETVHLLSFEINPVYYKITLTATPIPAVLPAGWTNPHALPLSGESPQLIVSASNNWGKLIGFSAGVYPAAPSATVTQINGSLVPQISEVTTILIHCDWVNSSRFSNHSSVIGSFVPDREYLSLLNYTPPVVTTYPVLDQYQNDITIRFTTQTGAPLIIKDASQTVITLLLEEPVR